MTPAAFHTVQSVGPPGKTTALFPTGRNRLILGDGLAVMRALPAASCDLLYLDPPFFSGKDHFLHNGTPDSVHSFADTWNRDLSAYLAWLEEWCVELRRLVTPTGALLLHLDWHAVHYAKVLLDRIWGARHFQNEFIWYYSGGGASTRRFARKHDTILFYTRSATRWTFHADRVREPYKWTRGQRRADGSARDYLRGKLADDVWTHHALLPWSEENAGYPTQKPIALLERLLLATTEEGSVVGDFVCGSGTTAVVAQRLGRRWIAADCARMAVCVTAERLAEALSPGSVAHGHLRPRARAAKRFEDILADDARIGVTAETKSRCDTVLLPTLPGFTIEGLAVPDQGTVVAAGVGSS